jgi:hypothetical protein
MDKTGEFAYLRPPLFFSDEECENLGQGGQAATPYGLSTWGPIADLTEAPPPSLSI